MEQPDKQTRNKGGRPVKAVRKNCLITLKCTAYEKQVIEAKARKATLTVSEYIREISLNGKIESQVKTFPQEVLVLNGNINHIAANVNQIAKKRNRYEQLSDQELEDLRKIELELKEIAQHIKNYLQ